MYLCLGSCGYNLYAELHQNYWNRLIHGLFMPFVVYGVFNGTPAVLSQTNYMNTVMTKMWIYIGFLSYYLLFDPVGSVMSAIVYYPVLHFSLQKHYTAENKWKDIRESILWISFAILVQELFGHTLFESVNSDLYQVFNSILIAPLFGARSLFHSV